jgi:membrane associated rhomboid family serine protease
VTDQPAGQPGDGVGDAAEPATCYRHPDREAHIRCVRCNRRICPDCMIDASVGFQCPECVREGNQGVRRARTVFGGRVSDAGLVTKVLIGLNALAFLVQQVSQTFTLRFADLPVAVASGEQYRLLTSAFLHGNLLHIALNMYALYLFGPPLEVALGRLRFIALYILSALGGSALSYAFANPLGYSLGASGAVFGLFGAFFMVNRRLQRDTSGLLVLVAVNLAFSFLVRGIDWRAHIGGLVTGSLVAAALVYAPRRYRALVQTAGFVVVAVLVVALVAWRTAQLT